ncbi:MAG: Uma2 family endonuclease [Oscillochloridaceae bacterium umkhey_bin13]
MAIELSAPPTAAIHYPTSDGQPMAENTKQFRWIVTIQGGLDALYKDDPHVFVAGDLLWYPVEGNPRLRRAPDALVVFGRPKGDRGAYLQWEEDDIAPQVVFEVLSPGNTVIEMARKQRFYDQYGVEEYYLYDPDHGELAGWIRREAGLQFIENVNGWRSPRLGIKLSIGHEGDLVLERPDGGRFLSYLELERERAAERERAEFEAQRAEAETLKAALFAAKLRELGIDPETLVT